MKIVLTRQLPGPFVGALNEAYEEVHIHEEDRPLSPTEIKKAIHDTDVVLCMLTDRIDREMIGDRLKCLITYSVGLDHLNLLALKKHGVRLSHTPDVLTSATADLTWSLILAGAREIFGAAQLVKRGGFKGFGPRMFLGKPVAGATLGIIGMGRIGKAVAARAAGFGMEVVYHSRTPLEVEEEKKLGAVRVSFEQVLRKADFLSLHCPLTPETKHMIASEEFAIMKKDALLVNTARGAIIEEAALVAHLRDNSWFRAALDVYEFEPEITSGLVDCSNALCLPHIGSADRPTREKMAKICVDEALAFAQGQPLRYEHQL